jgi:hypothetical protein
MSFAAVAVGTAAASLGTGIASSAMSADAQEDAADQNARNVKNTNQLNYKMWQESRGLNGNAVMPLYLTDGSGQPWEKALGTKLTTDWDKLVGSTSPEAFAAATQSQAPALAQANRAVSGLFNGQSEQAQMNNFAPVKAARVSFNRQSALDALNKTLSEINAVQAGQGFTGDSMGTRLLRFDANKSAGDTLSGVNLENLQEERSIHDSALSNRLQNAQLPATMAQTDAAFLRLPEDQYLDEINRGLQPMTFLRIGTAQPFQNQNLPVVNPIPSMGQIILQGVNGAANTGLSYWMQNQEQQRYLDAAKQINQPRLPYGASAGWDSPVLPANTNPIYG